ncbi:hypothetical protein [Nitrosovibrio sp. Nv6]|uniref:hypothetical protein n=1 Tax=Nitrosovibrio sp. Nv6 TaxID=1855340 RepID=UPI0008CB00FC|nr:hypothetical protein [Nitrosovibrio sp. Nv6]SEO64642.1 hypothetical protein SAMN05216316_0700 [Nitrosovibrio sp. Nv6]
MFGSKKPETICPLLKGACIESRCVWWTQIRGKHPQTGADIDMPDCAIKWLPVLLIETSKETRQAAAAVESLRNESVTASQQVAGAIVHLAESNHVNKLENKS